MTEKLANIITINLSKIVSIHIIAIISFLILFFLGYGLLMFDNSDMDKFQIGKLLLVLGLIEIILWTSHKGIEIDFDSQRTKLYHSIFGLRLGFWKHFEKPEKIVINRTVQVQNFTYGKTWTQQIPKEFFVMLFVYDDTRVEEICMTEKRNTILTACYQLAAKLNVQYEDNA